MSRRRERSRMAADCEIDPVALAAAYTAGPTDIWDEPYGGESQSEVELVLEELGYDSTLPPSLRPGYVFYPRDDEPEIEHVTPRYLQRGDVDKPPPKTAGRSSGGGGRSRKLVVPARLRQQRVEDERDIERVHTPRFQVYGLTRGEAEYYHRQPGYARQVLIQHVAFILAEKTVPPYDHPTTSRRLNFEVYGLRQLEIAVLRVARGSARAALAQYARAHDASRIALRDRSPAA